MRLPLNRRQLLLAPLSLAFVRAASAKSFTIGPITIGHPWAAPSVPEAAALFMVMTNNGDRADRLVAAATPIAETVIFRTHDGSPLEYYELQPRRPVNLRPGRRYIALRDLKAPLALDDTFALTLRFAEAGTITVSVVVEAGAEEDTPPG